MIGGVLTPPERFEVEQTAHQTARVMLPFRRRHVSEALVSAACANMERDWPTALPSN